MCINIVSVKRQSIEKMCGYDINTIGPREEILTMQRLFLLLLKAGEFINPIDWIYMAGHFEVDHSENVLQQ